MIAGVEWAPAIPSHWGHSRLRWVSKIFAGGTPDRTNLEYWRDGTIPWLNSGSVNDWIIRKPSESITDAGFASSSARWVPRHSVVIALAGQGKTKGIAARLEIPATTNQSMAAIVPRPNLDYRYLHYWLAAHYQSIRNLAGGDKRDGLNLQHIGGIDIPLPPREEQVGIADFLDRETVQIDTLIAKQEQLIATLRERRSSVISTSTLGGGGVLLTHRLKQTVELNDGGAWGDDPDGVDDVIVLRSTELTARGEWAIKNPAMRCLSTSSATATRLLPGDLVITKSSGSAAHVGKAGLVDDHVAAMNPGFGNFMQRLRFDADHNARFYWYAFQSDHVRDQIRLASTTTTGLANLTGKQIGDLRVPALPLAQQKSIATRLDAQTARIDILIAKAERFIELSKERRAALITAAVTGQIEVPAA